MSQPGLSDADKILLICLELQKYGMTPKEFIHGFLTKNPADPKYNFPYRRRTWATSYGLNSTIQLVCAIGKIFLKSSDGAATWSDYILGEAIRIAKSQSPPASGSFQSARSVTRDFFSQDSRNTRNHQLTHQHMPFVYSLVASMLASPTRDVEPEEPPLLNDFVTSTQDVSRSEDHGEVGLAEVEDRVLEMEGLELPAYKQPTQEHMAQRTHHIATVVCSMLVFARNRRHNGLQLNNAIRFLACGVSETVNDYLHHIGLTSCRKTALQALSALAREAEGNLHTCMALEQPMPVAPILCIDNLDMEERVHMNTVGKRNRMFHGTWGYIHIPNPNLLRSLNHSELSLEAFHASLKSVSDLVIEPAHFLNSDKSTDDYSLVWKSQIARVMSKYIAQPSIREGAINLDPPEIDPIEPHQPDIHMLRLMDESDDSAEGMGQVLEAIQRQSGLAPDQFFNRLQLVDGDLGTCQNFNTLRTLRIPSHLAEESLKNVFFTLGASHTLWNIAHNILTTHFGNIKAMDDVGVWRYFEALSIPPQKVLQKKDFTKMLQHMEQVHEATIFYFLRVVMGTEHKHWEDLENIPSIPTAEWNSIIEECYSRFCSKEARAEAANRKSPKLHNLLVRLRDFSTVIEANRSMRAGDVGRLLNVWKLWSVMTQSLSGLTHYSAYLPRLVLLLTEVFPPSLSRFISHNLLVSPSGRPGHFVAKDFFLETHNYWLKFFYNRSGIGTQVKRLKNLFSSNIPLLRSMFNSLRGDSHSQIIHQSHIVTLKTQALRQITKMANSNDILDFHNRASGSKVSRLTDSYLGGIRALQNQIIKNDEDLGRFKLHLQVHNQPGHQHGNADLSDAEMYSKCSSDNEVLSSDI